MSTSSFKCASFFPGRIHFYFLFEACSVTETRSFSTLFQLSAECEAIRKECRTFAERELAPLAEKHDKLSLFPTEQIKQLGQDGLLGACIDRKYGGRGFDLLTLTAVIEEISRCCASTGIILSIHNCLYADLIQTFGSQQQIERYLVPYIGGEIGVFALSEHGTVLKKSFTEVNFISKCSKCLLFRVVLLDAGSDAASLSTTATKIGSEYVLNGRKAW